jgi:hypothetical protein
MSAVVLPRLTVEVLLHSQTLQKLVGRLAMTCEHPAQGGGEDEGADFLRPSATGSCPGYVFRLAYVLRSVIPHAGRAKNLQTKQKVTHRPQFGKLRHGNEKHACTKQSLSCNGSIMQRRISEHMQEIDHRLLSQWFPSLLVGIGG